MSTCRACGNRLDKAFLSLGNSPLSNAYLSERDLNKAEPYYPLDLFVCGKCFLVQLEEFEKPKDIFSSDYAYFSSYSQSWLDHCQRYVKMIVDRFGFDKDSFVIEVASNDGYLLQYFKDYDIPVLGVEPAGNTAEVAIKKGIPTDVTFFNTPYAQKMLESGRQADLIIGNNVLAHNPYLNDFVEGLRIVLKPGGIVTMEFPHLLQLIRGNQFDTIYHEHFSYFSFFTAKELFAAHGLEMFDVEEIPTHGGSLCIYARHAADGSKPVSWRVGDLLKKERDAGLLDLETYSCFSENVRSTKRNLLEFLIDARNEGKKIVGYGAPAKGNTLLNYCGIRTDFLDYTVDISSHKQNKFLPGTHIPIFHPDRIREDKPDYVLILPWNIKEEIMAQMAHIREWDGKFVVPIPKVEVYR
jgi:SAM-dependent methyltransferase